MTAGTTGQGPRRYQIRLHGRLDEAFVAAYCPPQTVLTVDQDTTCLTGMHTDQAGIVGLIRHLHNLGLTILALQAA